MSNSPRLSRAPESPSSPAGLADNYLAAALYCPPVPRLPAPERITLGCSCCPPVLGPSSDHNDQLSAELPSATRRKRTTAEKRALAIPQNAGPDLFVLGRPCCSPFVFGLRPPYTPEHVRWNAVGEVDEAAYLARADILLSTVSPVEADQDAADPDDDVLAPPPLKQEVIDLTSDTEDPPPKRRATTPAPAHHPKRHREHLQHDPTPTPLREISPGPFLVFKDTQGWTAQQTSTLWKAQLYYGDGKNWNGVVAAVNAEPKYSGGVQKSASECRHKWQRERIKVWKR